MAINGQNAAAIKALVTGATTTEADFRTGTDHIIDHIDSTVSDLTTIVTAGSSENYTVPAGYNKVLISGAGGGGGGGGGASGVNRTGGGGGSAGRAYRTVIAVTPGTYSVVAGAAGAAGDNSNGGNGGASSFGNIFTMNGGLGGGGPSYSQPPGGAGGSVANNSGVSGGHTANGDAGGISYNNNSDNGLGANSSFSASGVLNLGYGGDGSRTINGNTSTNLGWAGGGGIVIIELGE